VIINRQLLTVVGWSKSAQSVVQGKNREEKKSLDRWSGLVFLVAWLFSVVRMLRQQVAVLSPEHRISIRREKHRIKIR
jgi:hypothetical protein